MIGCFNDELSKTLIKDAADLQRFRDLLLACPAPSCRSPCFRFIRSSYLQHSFSITLLYSYLLLAKVVIGLEFSHRKNPSNHPSKTKEENDASFGIVRHRAMRYRKIFSPWTALSHLSHTTAQANEAKLICLIGVIEPFP